MGEMTRKDVLDFVTVLLFTSSCAWNAMPAHKRPGCLVVANQQIKLEKIGHDGRLALSSQMCICCAGQWSTWFDVAGRGMSWHGQVTHALPVGHWCIGGHSIVSHPLGVYIHG